MEGATLKAAPILPQTRRPRTRTPPPGCVCHHQAQTSIHLVRHLAQRAARSEAPRHSSQRVVNGSSANRACGSSRVFGDYTLSKTLGVGSMSKVKLTHHNVTREKVRRLYL